MKNERYTREVTLCTSVDEEDITLSVLQDTVGDVGAIVWDSALSCVAYLAKCARLSPSIFDGKAVVELGAGTAICGMAISALGAKMVYATDLAAQLPLIRDNVIANNSRACAFELDWCNDAHRKLVKSHINQSIDYILMVDCIYYNDVVEHLIATLLELCTRETKVICFYERRDIGQPVEAQRRFFEIVGRHFTIDKIENQKLEDEYVCDDIATLILTLK